MRAHLIVVTGTGTGIGKTHVTEALLRAWGLSGRVCGLKPIESGVPVGSEGDDSKRLRLASTFHVKQSPPYVFEPPVSPRLAAKLSGATLDLSVLQSYVASVRAEADGVIVELPGGLYSPLSDALTNADLASALEPTRTLVVAPNRLGVLHDLGAVTRAARASGLALDGIILSDPAERDLSSETNEEEAAAVLHTPVLCWLPRASAEELASYPALRLALTALLQPARLARRGD
jgi:dethiobiotin synthetase